MSHEFVADDTIRNLDPFHLTVGAGFCGNKAAYGDSGTNSGGNTDNDALHMLPSITCGPGHGTASCEAPWGPGCSRSDPSGMCHTVCDKCSVDLPVSSLQLGVLAAPARELLPTSGCAAADIVMIEN